MLFRFLESIGKWLSPSPPVIRSPQEQQCVDEAVSRLTLYYFPSCPYCFRVVRILKQLNLNMRLCNIHTDRGHYQKLVNGGGKQQVPCLLIRKKGGDEQWLYESGDIVRYLRKNFGET